MEMGMGAAMMAVLIAAGVGAAQPGQPTRVDPGHGDTSPNAVSLRVLNMDLRQPTDFQHVYKFSTTDVFGRAHDSFMRTDGAVTAVFPRSVYVPTRGGLMPDIPPGTVFYIGGPPAAPRPMRRVPSTFLSISADAEASLPPPVVVTVRASSMITDEAFRQRRVEALMSYALER